MVAKIILNSSGGKSVELNVKVQPRVHLGVADIVPRLGGKTDTQHIMEIFGNIVDRHFGG